MDKNDGAAGMIIIVVVVVLVLIIIAIAVLMMEIVIFWFPHVLALLLNFDVQCNKISEIEFDYILF